MSNDTVSPTQDRGVCTNADRKTKHGNDGEPGRATKPANSNAKVLFKPLKPQNAPRFARHFASQADVSEAPTSGELGLIQIRVRACEFFRF